jgi:hypothetical protein
MPEYQEIFDSAQAQITALQGIERNLNVVINEIKDKEWNGPLSVRDRERLVEVRSAKASVLAAIEELAYVTMKALDKTDELKRINNALAGAVKDLTSTAERIAHIGKIADTITQVLKGTVALSKKVKAIIPAKPAAAAKTAPKNQGG